MIAALPGVVDDSVGSFPCRAKLSLGKVPSHCGDLAQDEVAYVKSSELYPLVVVFNHLLLEALSLTLSRQSKLIRS